MREVARAVGVHQSTVSRALDTDKSGLVTEETRARIERAAAELGYRHDGVASALRRGQTKTLGVVVADLGNQYIAPVLRGIENSLESRGMMALVAETQDDHTRFARVMDHLVSRRVDAIVVMAARIGDETALRRTRSKIPVVLTVRTLHGASLPTVTHDDERGGRDALRHLADLGHRKVAQLRGPQDISSFAGRSSGFDSEAKRAGIQIITLDDCANLPTREEGRRLMEALLLTGQELPSAVFAGNDAMAIGALEAITSTDLRCPEDIGVIGYNDTPMTEFTSPPLSTVRLPGYELGRVAADVAVALIENPRQQLQALAFPPVVVPRVSTLGWPAILTSREPPRQLAASIAKRA